jgi:hypothetical protein
MRLGAGDCSVECAVAVFDFWSMKPFFTTDLIHLRCRGKQKAQHREIRFDLFGHITYILSKELSDRQHCLE